MADELKSAQEALASADQMAASLGIQEPARPETSAGAVSWLEKLFPGLSEKMADASDEERAEVARATLKAQADSDPDSILNILGMDAMEKKIRDMIDSLRGIDQGVEAGVQTQPEMGANPGTVGQATRAMVGGGLPEEFE